MGRYGVPARLDAYDSSGGHLAAVCQDERLTILRCRLPRLTGCPAEGSDNFDRR